MLEWFHKRMPIATQLKLTVFMTLFDLLMTLVWVYSGNATEANPILNYTLDDGPLTFAIAKLTLGLGSLWIFFKNKTHKLVITIMPWVFGFYFILSLFHLAGLVFYLSYFDLVNLVNLNYL